MGQSMALTKEQALANLGAEEVANRQEGERLWTAHNDAFWAHRDAVDQQDDAVADKKHALRQQVAEMESALAAEINAMPGVAEKHAAAEAAEQAWRDFPGIKEELETDIDGDGRESPVYCAITGLVISEDDHVFEDPNTGEIVLKKALGIPLLEDGTFALGAIADA